MNVTSIPFGVADVTIGEGPDALKFDGVEYFQAEGGELSIEPLLSEITFQDFGEGAYDDYINGFTPTLNLVVGQNDLKLMQKLFAYHSEIVTEGGEVTGLTDERIGKSMRSKAVPVHIHPREMGNDHSLDIHIYKMSGVGAYNRTYESAQGTFPVELKGYPRDGADPSKPGNYYYIGETDPNA
ncbi:hypothetical protein BpsM61_00057 [Bacillus phage vB_BpsM-61]|nr:hypothetical protein BpsM61_00057 [Bacillus phage vB_BpsM-61]